MFGRLETFDIQRHYICTLLQLPISKGEMNQTVDFRVDLAKSPMGMDPTTYYEVSKDDLYLLWGKHTLNKCLVGSMCALSMLGSITIMLTFVAWKDIRTTSRKILLFLSISDFFIAASNLVGLSIESGDNQKDKDKKCVIQSFFTNSVSASSFLWTLTLAIYLYLAIVKNKQQLGKKFFPLFHVINWLLGPIINGIALYKGMLGYAAGPVGGGWCWIYHNASKDTSSHYVLTNEEITWITLDAKFLEVIVYPTTFVLYAAIKYKLHKELMKSRENLIGNDVLESARLADRKLIFVPLLLFMGRFWGILRCILAFSGHTSKNITTMDKVFQSLQGVGDSSQGFLNCIFFCFLNLRVYNLIKGAFLRHVCCQKKTLHDPICEPDSYEGSVTTFRRINNNNNALLPSSEDDKRPLLRRDSRLKYYGMQGD